MFYEFSLITNLRKSDLLAYVIKEIRLGITFPLAASKVHCCFSIPPCSHYSDKWTKVQTIEIEKSWPEVTLIEKWQKFSILSYISFPPKNTDPHKLFTPLNLLFFHPHPLFSQNPHLFKRSLLQNFFDAFKGTV